MDVYQEFAGPNGRDEDVLDYGPGYSVWSNENFDTESINHCIEWALAHPTTWKDRLTNNGYWIAIKSLRKLLEVPEEIRCCEPDNYDGENPALFPPPAGFVMIRDVHAK